MAITLTATAMPKPDNLSILADMSWRYFQINCGGWAAAQTAADEIILTDEGCSLTDGGCFIFFGYNDFLHWLEAEGQEHLVDDAESFLIASGMIDKRILSHDVAIASVAAIQAAIRNEEENRAAAIEHQKTIRGTGEFITGE